MKSKKRLGQEAAFYSFVKPFLFYFSLASILFYLTYDKILELKGGVLLSIAFIGIWRYGLMIINYTRALIYAKVVYPKYKQKIAKLPFLKRYPKTIYFIIPSYKEEPWVTTEVFQSLISDINSIPSNATLFISTASDMEDSIIRNVFDNHPNTQKIKLVFQKQKDGKRIAMGHMLRALAREMNSRDEDDTNSVTIFMDGDTYIPINTLKNSLPFFAIEPKLGALTTNEIGFIQTKSSWYKDWFNLKFAQRHVLFQSHSLSKRVLTLTGRFSMFRSTILISEEFISFMENDIMLSADYGKFRFLMGDDKSSWYYLMKKGWEMLYLPDITLYSLESRDGSFLKISASLPYRWYGNTLRNNKRSRALTNQPFYIKYLFYDQLALMWTSLIGVTAALLLSIFKSILYLVLYVAWTIYVRLFQMSAFVISGHKVSMRTIPLILYNQWYGALIKINSFFHLSNQNWSKNNDEVQSGDVNFARINHPLYKYHSPLRMSLSILIFILFLLLLYTKLLAFPSLALLESTQNHPLKENIYLASKKNNQDYAEILNQSIKNAADGATIDLPSGTLNIYHPIVIERNDITLVGHHTRLLSHMHNNEEAIILIQGKRGKTLGKTEESLYNKSNVKVLLHKPLKTNSLLLIEEPNDKKFVQQILGSHRWYKKYPLLRSEIVKTVDYKKNKIVLEFQSKSHIDAGAKISLLHPVAHITIKNLVIDSIYSAKPYQYIYQNSKKNLFIDGIKLLYATDINLKDITILNSGSSPLVLERSYMCKISNLTIDGAINKGKKGNGYLRINKSFHNNFENVSVKHIRHITFQWASAYNSIKNLYTEVDINFHGGATHDNLVSHVTFNVNLKKHKWGRVYHTPKNASWAPPDYNTNRVLNIKIQHTSETQ